MNLPIIPLKINALFGLLRELLIKKGRLLPIFLFIFLIIPFFALAFIVGNVSFLTGFEKDEGFNVGDLPQQNWNFKRGVVKITDTKALEGENSLWVATEDSDIYVWKTGLEATEKPRLSFWYYTSGYSRPDITKVYMCGEGGCPELVPFVFSEYLNKWTHFQLEYRAYNSEFLNQYRTKFNNDDWSSWADITRTDQVKKVDSIYFYYVKTTYFDNFIYGSEFEEVLLPDISFDYPLPESEITSSPLEIGGHFERWNFDFFKKLRLTGCAFNTQKCLPYQDRDIYTETGDFSFIISKDITQGDWIFTIYCIGKDNNWYLPATYIELFLTSKIDFASTTPPKIPEYPEVEFQDPLINYATSTGYATPTLIFNSLNKSFGRAFIWIFDIVKIFDYFNVERELAGKNIGQAISTGRAYLGNVNAFFSDLPIIEIFFFYLITLMIVIIIRFIKFIRNLLPF